LKARAATRETPVAPTPPSVTRERAIDRPRILLLIGPLVLARCSGPSVNAAQVDADGGACDGTGALGAVSSLDEAHTHTLCVLRDDLDDPPSKGATYTTGIGADHTHDVELAEHSFEAINSGGDVLVVTSKARGHSHVFRIP